MNLYEIKAKAGNAELLIYGDIGSDFWGEESNDAKTITEKLKPYAGKPIDVRINSVGGSVIDALAIHNALKRHGGDVRVHIDGLAASAASLIAMAGSTVHMAENALLMIHAPMTAVGGNAEDMREAAEVLDRYAGAMIGSYTRNGKIDAELVESMLRDGKDHYFTADEALAAGFADQVSEAIDIAAALKVVGRKNSPIVGITKESRQMSDPKETAGDTNQPADDFLTKHRTVVAKSEANGAKAERTRIRDIQNLFSPHGADDPLSNIHAVMENCIDDENCNIVKAQNVLLSFLADQTSQPIASAREDRVLSPRRESRIEPAADQQDKFVEGATRALAIRAGIDKDKDSRAKEAQSEYLSMTMVELCKHSLKMAGRPVNGSATDIVKRVVMAGPGQGTDHFPAILENIANKSVMDGYMGADETWGTYTQQGTLNDYRTASRVNKSLFDTLDKMEEYDAFKSGRFADVKQSITGYLHGKSFSLTLQSIVNDDLSILSSDAMAWGEAANVTIGDAVFVALTAAGSGGYGQTMDEDSTILFHADHSNYIASGSGAAPSKATIGAGRTAMMTQLDPNGRIIASRPRYLLHGTTLTMDVFELLNSQNVVTGADATRPERNAVSSLGLQGVEEYRIDDFVSTAWILAAARRTVEVSFVGGQSTPSVDRMPSGEIPGVTWQISIPFGVAALDYRTLYFNYGA